MDLNIFHNYFYLIYLLYLHFTIIYFILIKTIIINLFCKKRGDSFDARCGGDNAPQLLKYLNENAYIFKH